MAREAWRPPSKRCGARNRDGSPCPAWAMPNGRCRMHGGKSPGRPVVHGRRSKNPLVRLLAQADGLSDGEKVALWMCGPRRSVTPCSPNNPMGASGGPCSLPNCEPLPGAVVAQYRTRGGRRFGPYWFRAWRDADGRQRKVYVPRRDLEAVRAACRPTRGKRSLG